MSINFPSYARRGPDFLMEELVQALLRSKSLDFKALFSVVHTEMKIRKISGGGEEMMRLRTYDKLQELVRTGSVTKTGKLYKGLRKGLLLKVEALRALHSPRKHLPHPPSAKDPAS